MNKLNSIIEQDEHKTPESKESKRQRFHNDLTRQFASLPMAIFADVRNKRLTHRDVCLYMHVLVKQGTKKSSFWGIDSLALLTGTNPTSVKDSLRRLVACGHIKRCRGKNTSHTVCLTHLLPGLGFEGIRVKGKKIGEGEPEISEQLAELSSQQPQASIILPPVEVESASDNHGSEDGDTDAKATEAFFNEWDDYFASAQAEDRSRRWAAIQSIKY